jgi:SIR2-like domain
MFEAHGRCRDAVNFSDTDWDELLDAIKNGSCIPFLGAGACAGYLPNGRELAEKLADLINFPFTNPDRQSLTQVATYAAVQFAPITAKRKIIKILLESQKKPDFGAQDEPHGVLSKLPFPFYLTTNYDDLMSSALEFSEKDVTREVCRWSDFVNDLAPKIKIEPDFKPHPARPVVFHLHGYDLLPASIVVTEDDYLEFLSNLASRDDIIPPVIRKAMVGATFLFVGYSLNDWNFRILFQGLRKRGMVANIAVIKPPSGGSPDDQTKMQRYFEKYYGRSLDLQIAWTTAGDFCAELARRVQTKKVF